MKWNLSVCPHSSRSNVILCSMSSVNELYSRKLGDCVYIYSLAIISNPTVYRVMFSDVAFWEEALFIFSFFRSERSIPHWILMSKSHSYGIWNQVHDENVGGYPRRKFRFSFFRYSAESVVVTIYLGLIQMLRIALNIVQNPMSAELSSSTQYHNFVTYAAAVFLFLYLVGFLAYIYLTRFIKSMWLISRTLCIIRRFV